MHNYTNENLPSTNALKTKDQMLKIFQMIKVLKKDFVIRTKQIVVRYTTT